ncbi:hypothetical protein GCM10022226_58250 [Sphaerisporangium flaviroseum]|uniref:Uncharacterized protein n=1 Tax=Sphaerisporangium flaviroseum TaxID=509199 RepID=A0ABP7IZ28_9ACTN
MTKPIQYQMHHFSQSNPRGPEQDDVPALLRRVAASIEKLGEVQVYDLIMHNEITEEGLDWPSVTVYFDYAHEAEEMDEHADADTAGEVDEEEPEPSDPAPRSPGPHS